MRSPLTGILLLLSLHITRAQNPKIDSLNRLINQAETDTARINLTNKKVILLNRINIDSAIILSLKMIADAQRIKYKQGEATARTNLAFGYSFKGNFVAAKQNLKLAEAMATSLKDSTRLLLVYNMYGTSYGMQSKYDSSIAFLEKSRTIAERKADTANLGSIYLNLGTSYSMLSNQPQALRYQQKSLSIAEAQNNFSKQATCLVNIGNTYKAMGNLKGAEQRYTKAIRLAQQEGIRNVELYGYTNLVEIYTDLHNNQQAYKMAMKAADLGKQMGDVGTQATNLSKAATSLAKQKKFAQAELLNKQAMSIADSSGQPLNVHQTYAAMGAILKWQGRCGEAIPYYEKSFHALKDADIYDSQTGESYKELSTCYEQTGNYPRALATFKISAAIADSVRGRENVQKATELTMTYEFDKKQQAAQAEQQKQNALARTRQLSLLAGLGFTLVLAAVSFYAYRTKQKANGLLQVQKEELQRQKEELEQTLTKLQNTQTQLIQSEKMASLGELTAGIAHEIQNPLNFVNNFSAVSTELIDEIREERKKAERDEELEEEILDDLSGNLAKINHHGGRASSIVKSMLEHSRTSTGEKQRIDLNALTDEYLRLSYHGLRTKDNEFNTELVTTFDPTLNKIEVIPQDLGRVLLNLFNNAFYAVRQRQKAGVAGYQPSISVTTRQQNGRVEIRIRDNGTGIPETVLAKIFQPFFTTKPTGEGTGLGLSLSYDIITKGHQGTLSVQSQEGEGSEFIIQLPTSVKKSVAA